MSGGSASCVGVVGDVAVAAGPLAQIERSFGERLAAAVAERESQVVLGIDPDPAALWPGSDSRSDGGAPAQRAASAVLRHCRALIDAAGPACVAVKPQFACFERLGAPGVQALAATIEHARTAGLLVIADAKRGDIDVSVRAYAQSLFGGLQTPFGSVPGLGADMATINPLMGEDTLASALAVARESRGALLVLVRTSNPGAADVQELALAPQSCRDGEAGARRIATVWERLATMVAQLGADGVDGSGCSDVGAVVGATAPDHLRRARELMPHAVMLLPGIGAQGGRVEDLAPVFAQSRHGGLVSASRSIVSAHRETGGDPAGAARVEAERLRAAAWRLSA